MKTGAGVAWAEGSASSATAARKIWLGSEIDILLSIYIYVMYNDIHIETHPATAQTGPKSFAAPPTGSCGVQTPRKPQRLWKPRTERGRVAGDHCASRGMTGMKRVYGAQGFLQHSLNLKTTKLSTGWHRLALRKNKTAHSLTSCTISSAAHSQVDH